MSFRAGRTGGEYCNETVIEALGKRGAIAAAQVAGRAGASDG